MKTLQKSTSWSDDEAETALSTLLASSNEYALLAGLSVDSNQPSGASFARIIGVCYRPGVTIKVKVTAAGMLEDLASRQPRQAWVACSPLLLEALAVEKLDDDGGGARGSSAAEAAADEAAAVSAGGRLEDSTATWQRSESALVLLRSLVRGDMAALQHCAQAAAAEVHEASVGVSAASDGGEGLLSFLLSGAHVANVQVAVQHILTAATAAASHYVREAAYHAADAALQWLTTALRAAPASFARATAGSTTEGSSAGAAVASGGISPAAVEAARTVLPACIDAIACGLEDEHPQVRFAASSAIRTMLATHEFRPLIVCAAVLPRLLPPLAFNRYLGSERQRYFHQDVWKALVLADDVAPLLLLSAAHVSASAEPAEATDVSAKGDAASGVGSGSESASRRSAQPAAAVAAARRRSQAAWRRAVPAAPAELGRDRASSPLRSASLAATITSAVGGVGTSSGSSGSSGSGGGAGSPGRPAMGRAVSPLPGGSSPTAIAIGAAAAASSMPGPSSAPWARPPLGAPPSPPLASRAHAQLPPSHVPLALPAAATTAGAHSPIAAAAGAAAATSAPSSVTLPAAVAAGSAAGPRLVALHIARVVDFYLAQAGVPAGARRSAAATAPATGGSSAAGAHGGAAEVAREPEPELAPHPDVQEAACNCCAELAVKIDAAAVQPHVQRIAAALLWVAANADDWRPRDVAVVALGRFYACFPHSFAATAGGPPQALAQAVGEQQLFTAWIARCFDVHRAVRDHAASVLGEAAHRAPASASGASRTEGATVAGDAVSASSSPHPLVLMAEEARRRVAALHTATSPAASGPAATSLREAADADGALALHHHDDGDAASAHVLPDGDVTAVDGVMFLLRELAGPAPTGGTGTGSGSTPGEGMSPGRRPLVGADAAAGSSGLFGGSPGGRGSPASPATGGAGSDAATAAGGVVSLSARLAAISAARAAAAGGSSSSSIGGVVSPASPTDSPAVVEASALGLGLGLGRRSVRGGDGSAGTASGGAGAAASGPLAAAAAALDECLPRALALLSHRDCPTQVHESSCRIVLDIAQVRQALRSRSSTPECLLFILHSSPRPRSAAHSTLACHSRVAAAMPPAHFSSHVCSARARRR